MVLSAHAHRALYVHCTYILIDLFYKLLCYCSRSNSDMELFQKRRRWEVELPGWTGRPSTFVSFTKIKMFFIFSLTVSNFVGSLVTRMLKRNCIINVNKNVYTKIVTTHNFNLYIIKTNNIMNFVLFVVFIFFWDSLLKKASSSNMRTYLQREFRGDQDFWISSYLFIKLKV